MNLKRKALEKTVIDILNILCGIICGFILIAVGIYIFLAIPIWILDWLDLTEKYGDFPAGAIYMIEGIVIASIVFVIWFIRKLYRENLEEQEVKIKKGTEYPTKKTEYDLYLDALLERVKKEGILVEKMEKGTPFIFEKKQYKKDLGAVPVRNISGIITNVYLVYEDIDGSIKYYDYPQNLET